MNQKQKLPIKPIGLISLFLSVCFVSFLQAQQEPPLISQVFSQPPEYPAHLNMEEKYQPKGKFIREGLFKHSQPVFEAFNEVKNLFAGTIEGNLYLRENSSEETTIIANSEGNWKWDIEDALWSPNGKYLWVKQINQSKVPQITLQTDKNKTEKKHYTRAGQPIAREKYFVIEPENLQINAVPLLEDMTYTQGISWSNSNTSIYFLESNRLLNKMNLMEYSIPENESRLVLEQQSESYQFGLDFLPGYGNRFRSMGYVTILDSGFVWQSEKSGFNQLYYYDFNGDLIRQLTQRETNGIVQEVALVDDKNGYVYFIGSGDLENPFDTQFYRTEIKTGITEKLVDGPSVFYPEWNRTKDSVWLLQSISPYKTELNNYSANGTFAKTDWTLDLNFTKDYGYAPEYLSLNLDGKDNIADVLILKPKAFDENKTYPVVEYIYGGAFEKLIPRNPFSPGLWQLQDLANEGFVIVLIDTRGTPGRGKAFQDFTYGKMGQLEIYDHALAIEQLAKKLPYFDISKVGVLGHSWGGYFALRAMIMRPDLYKAAHLNAPAVDLDEMRIPVEIYMGCLPVDCAEEYKAASVTPNVKLIQGPVQIIHGTADDDVPIEESRKLVKAFKDVGKTNYDYLEWIGVDHIVMRERAWQKQVNDFFKSNLKKND